MLVIKRGLFIVSIPLVPGGILRKGVKDPCVGKETGYRLAFKGNLPVFRFLAEEIPEPEPSHKVLEEKVANVQPGGGRGRVICMRDALVEVSRQSILYPSRPVFFIPLPYLLTDISLRIVCDLQKFRMFAEIDYIFGCNFLSVAETLLAIISRIFESFIKI